MKALIPSLCFFVPCVSETYCRLDSDTLSLSITLSLTVFESRLQPAHACTDRARGAAHGAQSRVSAESHDAHALSALTGTRASQFPPANVVVPVRGALVCMLVCLF